MDIANSIIGFVKDFGPTVRKYVKYQIHHNNYVSDFQKMQKQLKDRQDVVVANLKTQLKQPGKITNKEVETWLEEAHQEIVEVMIEDLICKGGCFTYICSSRKLDKKTKALNEGIFKQGEKYTNAGVVLVVDDHSIQYCASVFEDKQKEVKHQREKIEANLKTQLMQPGKIAWKKVEDWQEKASQQIAMKVEDLISQGECSSSTNIEEKIEELKRILEKGKEFTNDGVSLVVDDHSIQYCVSAFEEKQKQLKYRKEKIEANLKTQLRQPRKIASKDVEDWLEKVSHQITMKIEDLISQGEGSSSTNLEERIEELKRILQKGKEFTKAGVSLVVDGHPKKGVTLLVEKCIARDNVQEEILQLLREDKVTRISVCGMGGVGKTTIIKQVHNKLLKEPKFAKVVWVKLSKDFDIVVRQKKQFDILKFQKCIARKLGLDLKNEDQDATELAGLLSDTLQQGSCVLILDDVWEPFSLEDVGIPDLVGNNGCKLVLTTRLQQKVARAMECEVIQVKPLLDDEALALFLYKVGSAVLSYPGFKSDIEPFLKQILKKCNGLPLAIGVVAKTMRGKSDPYSWEIADKELSKSEEIVDHLKFSYDHLEEQYKKCFLYSALYPEDYEIPKEELIEFWIEEGFITDERGSRHLMICEGHVIFEKLIDNCMLELVKKKYKGYWLSIHELIENKNKEDRVIMHDLLREMALNMSPQFMMKAGMALEELPEEHEWREDLLKVSLMNNNIREIPSSMSYPKCPMLTTLLLSNNNITTIPEAFFYHMPGLKILDLSRNYKLGRLPSSISKLENLTTLLLENCVSLKEVPSLSNLRGLKKLNISGTSIEELPQSLNMLTNLKYLRLGGRLSEIPGKMLQNLSKLQYLGVDLSIPLKWEEIGRLRKLESLDGRFSTVDDMSFFIKSESEFPNWYRIFVGSYNENDAYNYNKTFSIALKIIVCCHIDICKEPNWLPPDAQGFYIFDCKGVKSLNHISSLQDATDLRYCTVDECDGLEFVVSSNCLKPLQNLESLYLYNLSNLNAMFGEVGVVAKLAPLPVGTFSSLQKIRVWRCGKIKKLLPLRLLQYLHNLRTIKVRDCNQLEEIIWSEYEGGEGALEKLTLPKLERLALVGLPALKSIYSSFSTVLICDSIKAIEIKRCREIESVFGTGFNPLPTLEYLLLGSLENLKSVFDEEALGLAAPRNTFFSLKAIDVFRCHEIKKVFSSGWLLGHFQSLEAMQIYSCDQMEELISSSTYEEKEALEKIPLPKLQRLGLKELPELKCICSSSNMLICDSIKSLEIVDCEKLKRIPLYLSSLDIGQPSSLKQIQVDTKGHWESLE
ncbi:hypothetical protein SLEP1_g46269 [Rubroshorea leprosula]|uniref:AAA+ ATPase domain-containing protein n=2 Tax=Rubroshorea leprosula TaxID=152421 RepID=A0AAV5LNM4_9ROSI|nr:hypothetical protein SLEP1_g46269 [Rubroshorea leprosula]